MNRKFDASYYGRQKKRNSTNRCAGPRLAEKWCTIPQYMAVFHQILSPPVEVSVVDSSKRERAVLSCMHCVLKLCFPYPNNCLLLLRIIVRDYARLLQFYLSLGLRCVQGLECHSIGRITYQITELLLVSCLEYILEQQRLNTKMGSEDKENSLASETTWRANTSVSWHGNRPTSTRLVF